MSTSVVAFRQHVLMPGGRAGLLASLLATGCVQEANVIDGAGGAGGAIEAPPVTIEEVRAACTELCEKGTCDLWPHFCETQCNSVLVDGCYAESFAILECLVATPEGDCSLSSFACEDQVSALYDCQGLIDECGTGACVPGGGCNCSGLCGPQILVQDCVQVDAEHATCTCYSGDDALFTCEETTASCTMAACCGLHYF